MRKENCLLEFKKRLYGEVSVYLDKEHLLEDKIMRRDVLASILDSLDSYDVNVLNDNSIIFNLQVKSVYDEITAEKLIDMYASVRSKFTYGFQDEESYEAFTKAINKLRYKINLDCENVISEIEVLSKELKDKEGKIRQYRRIQSNLKYKNQIDFFQEEIIKEYLKNSDFSQEEQVLILDALRLHNINIKNNTNFSKSYIERMLNTRLYKKVIDPELEANLRNRLYTSAKQLYTNIINAETEDDFLDIMTYLPNYEDGFYSKEEFTYISSVILNALIDDLNTIIDTIKDVNNYNNKDTRNFAIQEFNDLYHRFSKVYFYFKKSSLEYGINDTNTIDSEEEIEYPNKLVYLLNDEGISLAEKDLKDVPEEYYTRVKDLIMGKKEGILSSQKDRKFSGTNNNVKDYAKLEDDQIRIVYRLVEGNTFLILGICVKKADRDMTGYLPIINRDKLVNIDDQDYLDKCNKAEDSLFNYIDEYGRKQHR